MLVISKTCIAFLPSFYSPFKGFKTACSLKSTTRTNKIHKSKKENRIVMNSEKNSNKTKTSEFSSMSFLTFFYSFLLASSLNVFQKIQINPVFSAKFSNKNLFQKLSQVPVFAVTNATGQPYLANNTKGEQVGLIFFSHEDALALLKGMQKKPSSSGCENLYNGTR
mmetsp:Transcript_14835/g.29766  ORF Transcript_14835/g.29766 Transcript_14835/m.29766 type:complete len:166 (-) Transcript_14835:3844-4341(-)